MSDAPRTAESIFDVRGVRALVTGAASGLGQAIAEALADSGASVTLVDSDQAGLESERKRLAARGNTVSAAVADVSDPDAIRAVVDKLVEQEGGIDVVFANAGIHRGSGIVADQGHVESLSLQAWEEVMDVDLSGAFYTMQAAAGHMRRQRSGRIIVTSSTAGLRSDPYCSYGYIASKAALVNAARQAAYEMAPFNVRVNVIAPGPFRTNIGGAAGRGAAAEEMWAKTIPLGRMADPEELKGLALLLASDASSFITGAIIPIDGGALTKQHDPLAEQAPAL